MQRGNPFFSILLGIAFWASVIATGVITIILSPKKDTRIPYNLPVLFESAEGIRQGTKVYVLGVEKGFVRFLDYFPVDENGQILFLNECEEFCQEKMKGQVTFTVLGLKDRIEFYENYSVYTRYDGIIGEKVIEINPGSRIDPERPRKQYKSLAPEYLQPDEVLQLLTGHYERLSKRTYGALRATNYDDPVTILAELIYENREPLLRITKNLAEITYKINTGQGTVPLLINETLLVDGSDEVLREIILLLATYRELYESYRENKIFSNTLFGIYSFVSP